MLRVSFPHQLSGGWVDVLFVWGVFRLLKQLRVLSLSSLVRLLPGYDPGLSRWTGRGPGLSSSPKRLRSETSALSKTLGKSCDLSLSLPPQLPNGDK